MCSTLSGPTNAKRGVAAEIRPMNRRWIAGAETTSALSV
jgi:hypothetical protein